MNLEKKKWEEFFISDLFHINSGVRLTRADQLEGETPFIGATEFSNGITNFVSNRNNSLDRNILGVNYNGSVVENFYHPYEALFSDDVKRLRLKNHPGNANVYLFFKVLILQQKSKYQYGYKFNSARMERQKILVPVTDCGEPDYSYMEHKVGVLRKKLEENCLNRYREQLANLKPTKTKPLYEKEWREFFVTHIFNHIQRGRRLTKANQIPGDTPYISSTALNNGVDNFIGNDENVRTFENCLTIANSGSVGSTFYHEYKFVASDHVTALIKEGASKHLYLFLATALNQLSEKYNFNREISDRRMKREKLYLPVNKAGEPDYAYMEQYMINMEYVKRKRYLEYRKTKK